MQVDDIKIALHGPEQICTVRQLNVFGKGIIQIDQKAIGRQRDIGNKYPNDFSPVAIEG